MYDTIWLPLCFALITCFAGKVNGIDPFEGNFPTLKCVKPRYIVGCNESLVDAYDRTEASKSDKNGNRADTFAFLFTRRNRICAEFLHRCGGRLPQNTNYRTDRQTVLIVGGYISVVCDLAYFRELKDQLLYRDDYNVILIDWPWGIYPDIYSALRNGEVVGKQMAFLIQSIMNQTGISEDMFHIIGHSVGAHIAGYAGRYFTEFTGGKQIRRLTGLDPASAVYLIADKKDRLDASDAKMVDVIHTSAGDCLVTAIGTYIPSGHADFYVNGGYFQFNCILDLIHGYMKGDAFYATASFFPPLCFHFQSIHYFKASINACQCQFVAVECSNYTDFQSGKCRSCGEDGSNCAVMGMDWEKYPRKPGNTIYYLNTKIACPYCDNRGINLQGFPRSPVPVNETMHCFVPSSRIEICAADI